MNNKEKHYFPVSAMMLSMENYLIRKRDNVLLKFCYRKVLRLNFLGLGSLQGSVIGYGSVFWLGVNFVLLFGLSISP